MAEDASRTRAASPKFQVALAAWHSSLLAYVAATRAYMHEAGEAGPRALGARWATAERAVGDAALLIADATLPARLEDTALGEREIAPELATLMSASDAAEAASRALDTAAGIALSPSVQAAALAGMSRTYSDRLLSLGRKVREAEQEVGVRRAGAAASAAAAFLPLEVGAITAAYGDGRGGVATELYISALRCRPGPEALALLELAKGAALGVAADTPAAAAADTAALAEYHPLQAMTYTPAAWGPPREQAASSAANLSLPQARLSAVYDLEPLINRQRALTFGPLASTTAGLNYRLVERLRTIRTAVVPSAHSSMTRREGSASGPLAELEHKGARQEDARALSGSNSARAGALRATTDGVTVREIAAPPGLWAPFAGSRPCVEAYAAASADIILAGIRDGRSEGWGLDLRERYESAVRGELAAAAAGVCSEGALIGALVAEFEVAYGRAPVPPASLDDFRSLVVPAAPNPGDYLCAAIALVGFSTLDERLSALHMKPGPLPHAVIVREARVAQAIQAVDAGRKLWLRVKEAFRPEMMDPPMFALPAGQKKIALVAAFRRIATAAVQAGPVECMPSTLKLFAATTLTRVV